LRKINQEAISNLKARAIWRIIYPGSGLCWPWLDSGLVLKTLEALLTSRMARHRVLSWQVCLTLQKKATYEW
jgi:hypothetical protein